MSTIQPPRKFPLPSFVGKVIASKNNHAVFYDWEVEGWMVEAPTLFVYEGWMKDLLPDPWGESLYNLIDKLAYGKYKKTYKNMFIVSDLPFTEITIPLPLDTYAVVDELSNKFGLNQIEVILGMLIQMTSSVIETSRSIGK
jgi:hypothetical protein